MAGPINNRLGKPANTVPLADEAYRIARDGGFDPLAKQIEPILEAIRK